MKSELINEYKQDIPWFNPLHYENLGVFWELNWLNAVVTPGNDQSLHVQNKIKCLGIHRLSNTLTYSTHIANTEIIKGTQPTV